MIALTKLTFVLFQKACASFPFEKTFAKLENEKERLPAELIVKAFLKSIKPGKTINNAKKRRTTVKTVLICLFLILLSIIFSAE